MGIAAEKNNAVAGLVNFMRNIGSSVGTSVVTTCRRAVRSSIKAGWWSGASPLESRFPERYQWRSTAASHSGMNIADAQRHALARFYAGVQAQAVNSGLH